MRFLHGPLWFWAILARRFLELCFLYEKSVYVNELCTVNFEFIEDLLVGKEKLFTFNLP